MEVHNYFKTLFLYTTILTASSCIAKNVALDIKGQDVLNNCTSKVQPSSRQKSYTTRSFQVKEHSPFKK